MNNLKNYREFNEEIELNESIKPFLKNMWKKFKDSDFFKKNFSKIQDIYSKIENDVKKYVEENFSDLSDEDIKILKTYKVQELRDIPTNEAISEDVVRKIMNILGVSTGALGFISGIYSMVISAIEESAYNASSWFIVFVVLLAISGVINVVTPEKKKEKK